MTTPFFAPLHRNFYVLYLLAKTRVGWIQATEHVLADYRPWPSPEGQITWFFSLSKWSARYRAAARCLSIAFERQDRALYGKVRVDGSATRWPAAAAQFLQRLRRQQQRRQARALWYPYREILRHVNHQVATDLLRRVRRLSLLG